MAVFGNQRYLVPAALVDIEIRVQKLNVLVPLNALDSLVFNNFQVLPIRIYVWPMKCTHSDVVFML